MAPQPPPIHPDAALSLAFAVVAASDAPVVLLDGDLAVLAASTSFYDTFGFAPDDVVGRKITGLAGGQWDVPQLVSLLNATAHAHAEVEAYEMDLKRSEDSDDVRSLVLKARKLAYGDGGATRLLLTVSDVTEARHNARQKDDLLREKSVLLQEVHHRIANSLQIISAVILQSARRVRSNDARAHLHEAHERVMSVAAVQQQLVSSSLEDVHLRDYFGQLSASLAASMIRDHRQLSIEVTADDTAVHPNTSVSLGLIVTELVINALKHAFPDRRKGRILVDYRGGAGWKLSVSDDGIGMPDHPSLGGLGTNIVEALAKQLHARVQVTSNQPGTVVSVIGLAAKDSVTMLRPAARRSS